MTKVFGNSRCQKRKKKCLKSTNNPRFHWLSRLAVTLCLPGALDIQIMPHVHCWQHKNVPVDVQDYIFHGVKTPLLCQL